MKTHPLLHCLPLLLLLAVSPGCSEDQAIAAAPKPVPEVRTTVTPVSTASAPAITPPANRPIEVYRRDLLYMAFQAASALPLDPHGKSRGRAQEKVALTCLDLHQPQLAIEFTNHIADWRRGSVFADYADYCAIAGNVAEAEKYLQFADQIARGDDNDPSAQEWRRDTIRLKMARTYARLDKQDEAAKVARTIDPSSGQAFDSGWATTTAARADLVTSETLDQELASLDLILASAGSGQAFNTVAVCARLFDKFYADPRREKIGERIRTRDSKLPPDMHVSGLVEIGRIAVKHGDGERAKEALREATEFLATSELGHEYRLGLVPVMATIRHQAGEPDRAAQEMADGITKYHTDREGFRSTKRAEVLRPFAEAWHTMGDRRQAAELYELVLEEGMENPNSRPRAQDISETCLSMAKVGFEPDAKLLVRMREITSGLGDPW